jgi:hypothetical protein
LAIAFLWMGDPTGGSDAVQTAETPTSTSPKVRPKLRSMVVAGIGVVAACLGILAYLNVDPFTGGSTTNPPPSGSASVRNCPPTLLTAPLQRQWAIEADASLPGDCWTQDLAPEPPLHPGELITFLISYKNISQTFQTNVAVGLNLAPGTSIQNGTTVIFNGGFPHGTPDHSDHLADGGIIIGSYGPGATGYVRVSVVLAGSAEWSCDWSSVQLVGVGSIDGQHTLTHYGIASVLVYKKC